MGRTFNTVHREDWNKKIHNILKTIDLHTTLYIKTNNFWHEEQAQELRNYVKNLKTWIIDQENQ
jgi:hypothetical protein